MSNDVELHQGQDTALAISASQSAFTPQQVAMLEHIGVEGASDADLQVFLHHVQRTGLDPFARQIYMIARPERKQVNGQWVNSSRQTIQTGIDGYRLIGRRAADRSGVSISVKAPVWAHPDGGWRDVWLPAWGTPAAAKATIVRHGEEFTAVALFDEYKQTKRDGSLTRMWEQRPAGQIAKCAEALAWRMAFPHDLAGIYTDEEMQQADNYTEPTGAPRTSAATNEFPPPENPVVETITAEQWGEIVTAGRAAGLADNEIAPRIQALLNRELSGPSAITVAELPIILESLKGAPNV